MKNNGIFDKLVVEEIKTQSDYLADKIKGMIVSGEFEEGFVFPNENEFCKILNVSRSTLREAYKILDTQGFIKRTKHGTYIKHADDIAKQGNFAATLELADRQEMEEFILALEPEAVYLAAQKIDEEGIKKLEELMLACEEAFDDDNALIQTNYEFHTYLRQLADNNLIISAITAYYDIFNQQVIGNIYVWDKNLGPFKQKIPAAAPQDGRSNQSRRC